MQKTITSKALSLFLALLLSLGVCAAVQVASPTAWADTITDGAGNPYEVSFATNGTTDTLNGITVTTDYEVDLSGDGWGWNPATQQEIKGDRISFAFQFSGDADADGRLTVMFNGAKGNGGTFEDAFPVYVKEGQPIENNVGHSNTLYFHLAMSTFETYLSLTDITVTLDFEPVSTRELYIANLNKIGSNGVTFSLWAGGSGGGGGYYAVGETIGLDLWAYGPSISTGTYVINVKSTKAEVNATRTFSVRSGKFIDENLLENNGISFEMPDKDVDDFAFTVTFTPSGGGESTSTTSNKSNSGSNSGIVSNTPTPAPVNQTTAVQNVKDAVAAAKNSPNGASVSLKNVTTVTLDTLKQMAKAAGNTQLTLNADNLNADGSVDVRISFDPAQAGKSMNLAASTTSPQAQIAQTKFTKHFSNDIAVVNLSQKGSFGIPVRVAAKVDPKLNTSNLVFYSYDSEANSYTQIKNPQYKVDKNGYVHFTTSIGGNIVISDKPLEKK